MRRALRPAHVGAAALMLSVPSAAVALNATEADAQSAIQIKLSSRHLSLGRSLTVTGHAGPEAAGRTVALEFAPAGSRQWRVVQTSRVGQRGDFRLVGTLKRSGLVKVATTTPPIARTMLLGATQASAPTSSPIEAIAVSSRFQMPVRNIELLGGGRVYIWGHLFPGVGGRKVRLITRSGRGWRTLAGGRTGRHGGFSLSYRAGGGHRFLRVAFAGDRANTGSSFVAGQVTVFYPSVASWYDDAGSTACGYHAYYGVANKSLPCGTRVTFHRGGHTVTATVDDRGPYVGGREWDLNQNTAAALGFAGVDTVWTSF
jgi:hypothetical protein